MANLELARHVFAARVGVVVLQRDWNLELPGAIREQAPVAQTHDITIQRLASDRETQVRADTGWFA